MKKIILGLVVAVSGILFAGVGVQPPTPVVGQPPAPAPAKQFPRGAKPSPRIKLVTSPQHKVVTSTPAQFAVVPKQLSYWLNDQEGDCVSAEEAFAKAAWSTQCGLPETFIPDNVLNQWVNQHGYANGANLTEVMDSMIRDGITFNGTTYHDGPYSSVDFSNEATLQNAISLGPIKIGIDASALPSGAGNRSGWYAVNGGRYNNEDHCVGLCGYGQASWLYQQLGVQLPSGLSGTQNGYLLFTWNTIGFVSHQWLMGTCQEAWLRNPTTPGQSPQPTPVPPIPPTPPVPPTPGDIVVTIPAGTAPGNYTVGAGGLTPAQITALQTAKAQIDGLLNIPGPTVPGGVQQNMDNPQRPRQPLRGIFQRR